MCCPVRVKELGGGLQEESLTSSWISNTGVYIRVFKFLLMERQTSSNLLGNEAGLLIGKASHPSLMLDNVIISLVCLMLLALALCLHEKNKT